MCLDRLEHINTKGKRGYQVFQQVEGKLYPRFHRNYRNLSVPHSGKCEVPVNTWETDPNDYHISIASDCSYHTGFHIFLNRKHAKAYASATSIPVVIRRVRFRDVVATGIQELPILEDGLTRPIPTPVAVVRKRYVKPEEVK